MITDYESLFTIGSKWPPEDADVKERLALYERNENLFNGYHDKVWQDDLRRLRGDKSSDIRLKLNFFQLVSLLWADLVCGERPDVVAADETETDALVRIIQDNDLWSVIGDAVIDLSKFGDAVLKNRFEKRGIIENVPPEYWIPIVEAGNIKQVKAHVLAYCFETGATPILKIETVIREKDRIPESEARQLKEYGPISSEKISFLKVEIHTIGAIEHRLYMLKGGKIQSEVDLKTFPEFSGIEKTQETGLDDFAIIVIHNITSTKKYHGMDDYNIFIDIIRELELRYSQIFFVEDKFTDPWVYGPPIEEQDPRDGEYRVVGGSRYISLMDGQQPPGALTWDCQLPANFQSIGGEGWGLMQRFYELSETCKVAFDASAGGQGLSAQALKLMMWKPLKKSNRIQSRFHSGVIKSILQCSTMENFMGMPGAVEISEVKITWHDGLPQDHNADAQRESMLVNSKVRSAQGLMREKGMSKDQISQEHNEMMDLVL